MSSRKLVSGLQDFYIINKQLLEDCGASDFIIEIMMFGLCSYFYAMEILELEVYKLFLDKYCGGCKWLHN